MSRKFRVYFESLDDRVVPAAWEGLATLAASAADESSLTGAEIASPNLGSVTVGDGLPNRLGDLVILPAGPLAPTGGSGAPIPGLGNDREPAPPNHAGPNQVPVPPMPPPTAVASSGRGGLVLGWGGPSWLEAVPRDGDPTSITLIGTGLKPIVLVPPQGNGSSFRPGAPVNGSGGDVPSNPGLPTAPFLDSAWHAPDQFDDDYYAALAESLRGFFGSTFQFPGRPPVTSGSANGGISGGGVTTNGGAPAKSPGPIEGGADAAGDAVALAAKASAAAGRGASGLAATPHLVDGTAHHDHPVAAMVLNGASTGTASIIVRTELARALRVEAPIGVLVSRFREAINALLGGTRDSSTNGFVARTSQAAAGGSVMPEGSSRPSGGQGAVEASARGATESTRLPSLLACAVDAVAAVAPQFEEIVTRITPDWLADKGPLAIESSQWLDPAFDFGPLTLESSRNVFLVVAAGGALWMLRPDPQWNRKSRARWLSSVAAHDEVFANLGLEE